LHDKIKNKNFFQIVQIPQNAFLRFAHSLRRLNLAQNELGQLPAGLRSLIGLRQLNLDGNQLKELDEPTLKGLKGNLSELSLARNGLGQFDA
jgi:Leucine-rich repeat (LRR) protein